MLRVVISWCYCYWFFLKGVRLPIYFTESVYSLCCIFGLIMFLSCVFCFLSSGFRICDRAVVFVCMLLLGSTLVRFCLEGCVSALFWICWLVWLVVFVVLLFVYVFPGVLPIPLLCSIVMPWLPNMVVFSFTGPVDSSV